MEVKIAATSPTTRATTTTTATAIVIVIIHVIIIIINISKQLVTLRGAMKTVTHL